MYVAVRDWQLMPSEYESPIDALHYLKLDAVEIEVQRDFTVRALDRWSRLPVGMKDVAMTFRQHLKEHNVRPAALLTSFDFSESSTKDAGAWMGRALNVAGYIGAPVVRVDAFMAREKELTFDKRVRLMADGITAALEKAENDTVALGIENHGFQGNSLAFLLHVIQKVNSPRLGVTFDTGNFYWRGYPLSEVYGILELLARYAKHTHFKNIAYPEARRESYREAGWEYMKYAAPLDEGDIDHARVVRMLADAGYDGACCIEDESISHYAEGEERRALHERDVRHVNRLLKKLEKTESK